MHLQIGTGPRRSPSACSEILSKKKRHAPKYSVGVAANSEGLAWAGTESSAQPVQQSGTAAGTAAAVESDAAVCERDDGCCLSMHQPWASLLVGGRARIYF